MKDARTRKREQIVTLLDHWVDFFDPDGSTSEYKPGGGEDGGVALLPLMSRHPSVLELGRCLEELERVGRTHYRHVFAYFTCEWRIVRAYQMHRVHGKLEVRRDTNGVPMDDPKNTRRERVLPPWLRRVPVDRQTGEPETVAHGVDFLSGQFRGEVFVPSEILGAAA